MLGETFEKMKAKAVGKSDQNIFIGFISDGRQVTFFPLFFTINILLRRKKMIV